MGCAKAKPNHRWLGGAAGSDPPKRQWYCEGPQHFLGPDIGLLASLDHAMRSPKARERMRRASSALQTALLGAAFLLCFFMPVLAQTWPERPVQNCRPLPCRGQRRRRCARNRRQASACTRPAGRHREQGGRRRSPGLRSGRQGDTGWIHAAGQYQRPGLVCSGNRKPPRL